MPGLGFVHLHTHSEFSLLDGAARLDGLVQRAVELEMPALALTDHGVMYGAVEFYSKCKAAGIKPIVGVEAYVAPGSHLDKTPRTEKNAYHLLLLAKNEQGYKNLLKLTTIAAIDGFYYKPRIDHELLKQYHEGIVATSACLGGEVCTALRKGDYNKARDIAGFYRDLFGPENYYIEIQNHTLPEQIAANEQLIKIARELKLQVICTNDVHYLSQDDAYAHDVLLCIGTGSTVNDPNRLKYGANEFFMKSAEEMAGIFGEFPGALEQTVEIAERCNLEMDLSGRAPMPAPDIPEGHTPASYLRELASEGLKRKVGRVDEKYLERLEYELGIVERMGFAQYILIVRDFALFARQKSIFFGVRGSAAGSLTSFCTDITDIDPVEYELTFERFLNPERIQMPDIDMDFEDARRGEVIEYVTDKYGKDHVAQIITFGTLAARAAIKDAGRALGMPIPDVNRIVSMIPTMPLHVPIKRALAENPEFKSMYTRDPEVKNLVDTAMRLEGVSRHASVHAAGVVISHDPLVEYTPLQKSQDGGYVTQYTAGVLEKLGLLKMDFLGLINLSILGRAVDNIRKSTGETIDVNNIPLDDKKAFELLGRGDTTGIFQLESAGMRRYVQELKPTSVRDLAAMVALYRPGPMAHIPTFIRAKHGLERIQYPHPSLKEVLEETYGVIVYQDQVMRIAQVIAGYTLGQADILRRAMGKKKKEEMAKQRENFLKGAAEKGIPEKKADEIFNLIEPFAGYAFNKAHAVCYAMVAYQTAYLKANYPVEYMAALLACYIEKTDKMGSCLDECSKMGIPVLPPDVNRSDVEFTAERLEPPHPVLPGLAPVQAPPAPDNGGAKGHSSPFPANGVSESGKGVGGLGDLSPSAALTPNPSPGAAGEGSNGVAEPHATGNGTLQPPPPPILGALLAPPAPNSGGANSNGTHEVPPELGVRGPEAPRQAIRYGLVGIKNVGRAAVDVILNARADGGDFTSLADFCERTTVHGGVTRATIEALIQCGAFSSIVGHSNRRALVEALDVICQMAARSQRSREVGQGDLFGGPDAEPIQSQTLYLPDVSDFSNDEILKFERDLLGLYISDHPLRQFRAVIEKSAPTTVEMLQEMNERDEVTLGGLITAVKPFRSKKSNEPMAFLTLEDLAGKSVAVTVFPSVFKDYGAQVQKDRVVLLKGRISCRERVMADDEGGRNVELLADEIKLLSPGANGHKNGGAKALNIRLDRSRKDILFLLRRALEQFPGSSPVYLHCPQKVVSRITVEPSEELRGMVERLVGRQAVWVE